MIALAGDRIVAGDMSITGSIGVLFQYPQAKELLDKIGVSLETIKSSPMKAEPVALQSAKRSDQGNDQCHGAGQFPLVRRSGG